MAPKQASDTELLLAIYRAARELPPQEFPDAVLQILQGVLPFDSATWGLGFVNAAGLVVEQAHLFREVPGRYIGYEEVRAQDAVAFDVVRHQGVTRNFHMPTLYAGTEKRGMREYVERVRHRNGLVTTHATPGAKSLRWLALYRAASDAQFSERERRMCQALVPHLMEASIANGMHRADGERGRALADTSGFVHHMDGAFTTLVRAEWPDWTGRTLPAELLALLERGDSYVGSQLLVHIERSGFFAMLKVRRKQAIDDLTVRELAVAELITTGRTYKEIAQALELSPATVRNHIQRIHEKLDVRSNAELAAQLTRRAA